MGYSTDDETCRQLSPTSPSPTELAVTPMPTVTAAPGGTAASDGHTSAKTDALAPFTTAKAPLAPSSASSVNALGGRPSLLASEAMGWGTVGGGANATESTSPSTPLWPQFSRHSSLDSLLSPSSSGYRVSISMTCHPDQLANVMSQMSNYGSGVIFNFQTEE